MNECGSLEVDKTTGIIKVTPVTPALFNKLLAHHRKTIVANPSAMQDTELGPIITDRLGAMQTADHKSKAKVKSAKVANNGGTA